MFLQKRSSEICSVAAELSPSHGRAPRQNISPNHLLRKWSHFPRFPFVEKMDFPRFHLLRKFSGKKKFLPTLLSFPCRSLGQPLRSPVTAYPYPRCWSFWLAVADLNDIFSLSPQSIFNPLFFNEGSRIRKNCFSNRHCRFQRNTKLWWSSWKFQAKFWRRPS